MSTSETGAFSTEFAVEGKMIENQQIALDGEKYHPPEKGIKGWKRQRTM